MLTCQDKIRRFETILKSVHLGLGNGSPPATCNPESIMHSQTTMQPPSRIISRTTNFGWSIGAACFVLILASCAGMAAGEARSNPNVLTYEEIQSVEAANLYEVVQRLRPRWLTDRAARSTHGSVGILVYEDQSRLGDIGVLRQLPVSAARTMRYLDAATASSTLPGIGSGHVAGAIVISTR